jgi:hypothetical protein
MDERKLPAPLTDRTVCDQCRQRRVRCDRGSPCSRCKTTQLLCKHDYIPKRRGRKSGQGKVISILRFSNQPAYAEDLGEGAEDRASQRPDLTASSNSYYSWQVEACSTADQCYEQGKMLGPAVTSTLLGPLGRLIAKCVEIYLHDVYPIWPVLIPSRVLRMLDGPREPNENNMIFALCSPVITHMSGKSEYLDPLFSEVEWVSIARRLLSESLRAHENYGSSNTHLQHFWCHSS